MTDSNNELRQIVTSLARSAQAITNDHEERMQTLEDTVVRLEETVARLARIEEAQNRMLANLDDDRPTILRRLNSIENKIDDLIERTED